MSGLLGAQIGCVFVFGLLLGLFGLFFFGLVFGVWSENYQAPFQLAESHWRHHLPKPAEGLRCLSSVLKPHGVGGAKEEGF